MKVAQKKMKSYKRKGPGSTTKKLLKLLMLQEINGKTLLDIGGGIGAIQWAFLESGGKKTIDVDASTSYLKVAEAYSVEKNLNENAHFIHGNFIDNSEEVQKQDFVTLDKVVCCYPDFQSLLGLATDKCNETIALTFPMGGPISKFVAFLENIYFYFKKNPFGTFIHSPAEIEAFIKSKGFTAIHKKILFPWHVQVYKRIG